MVDLIQLEEEQVKDLAKNGTEEEKKELMMFGYHLIKDNLKKYCDLREDYYNLITLWIIGTYLHKEFRCYPYLFLNAMRGSGKTRILKLISSFSWNGVLIGSPSESVLFRTAYDSTMCIDEFESVGGKEKSALRELLNAAYKKGLKVKRNKKIKNKEEESYEIEEFDVYCPISMANIWGMEEVLSDRCLTLILEKSNDPVKTRLMELDGFDSEYRYLLEAVSSVVMCSVVTVKNIYNKWNNYISEDTNNYIHYTTLHNTLHYTNNTEPDLKPEFKRLFEKIKDVNLIGRDLELFFPLFIIANIFGEDILEQTLRTAYNITQERNQETKNENPDVMLIDYLVNYPKSEKEYVSIKEISKEFALFADGEDWINAKWVGRALKRLNLIYDKKRVGSGIKARINYSKAREKIKLFKDETLDIKEEKVK